MSLGGFAALFSFPPSGFLGGTEVKTVSFFLLLSAADDAGAGNDDGRLPSDGVFSGGETRDVLPLKGPGGRRIGAF